MFCKTLHLPLSEIRSSIPSLRYGSHMRKEYEFIRVLFDIFISHILHIQSYLSKLFCPLYSNPKLQSSSPSEATIMDHPTNAHRRPNESKPVNDVPFPKPARIQRKPASLTLNPISNKLTSPPQIPLLLLTPSPFRLLKLNKPSLRARSLNTPSLPS